MIAVAFFPPTPTAVGVLEVVQSIQAFTRDAIEFLQIALPFRMSGGCS